MSTLARTGLPLSQAQLGIYYGQLLDPGDHSYNTAEILRLTGDLDTARLRHALHRLLVEAEGLRARLGADDEPWQRIDTQIAEPDRLDTRSATDPRAAALAWIAVDRQTPLDLHTDRLYRHALIRVADHEHWLYQRIHHVAIDGFGANLLFARLAELYRTGPAQAPGRPGAGSPGPLAPLEPVLRADRAYQDSPARQGDRDFWMRYLDAVRTPASGPGARTSRRVLREVPTATVEAVRARATQIGRGWPELAIAAGAGVLHGALGRSELVLGMPVLGRLGTPALRVPTTTMNVVALHSRITPGDDPHALVTAVAEQIARTRAHHRYRHEHLRRDRGAPVLFDAVVNVLPFGSAPDFGPGLSAEVEAIGVGPVENVALALRQVGVHWRLEVDADPALWSPQRQEQLADGILTALAGLGGLGELAEWSAGPVTPAPLPAPDVLAAVVEQARRTPDAIAVREQGRDCSYAELLASARRIGLRIKAFGLSASSGHEPLVAVALERGIDALSAFLGAWTAGAGYLPLDPHDPPTRLRQVLADARPDLVITSGDGLRGPTLAGTGLAVLHLPLDEIGSEGVGTATSTTVGFEGFAANRLAYLIYTSGSTGVPKGVLVQHDSLAGFVAAARRTYGLRADDRVVQFAALHFDTSVEEIYPALVSGASVVTRPDGLLESVAGFLDWCDRERITVLDLPTAYWHELAYALGEGGVRMPASVRLVIIGGSAAGADALDRFTRYAPQVKLVNSYGPTETTVVVTASVLVSGPEVEASASV